MHADILIINGKCLAVSNQETYDWIAVTDNNISAAGRGEDYNSIICNPEKIIDAKRCTVLPGFYDSHFHLVQTGINSLSLDLSEAASFNDIGDLIQEQAGLTPGQPIRGIRLYESNLKEKRFPDRIVLDKFCNDVPVWLCSREYHTSILNTYAILHYKIPFTLSGIDLDHKNMPTGIFRHHANALLRENILKSITTAYRLEAVSGVSEDVLKKGITTINSMEGGYLFCDKDAEFVHEYGKSFPVDIVLFYQTTNISRIKEMNLKRIGGSLFVDGSFGSRNAALFFEYNDKPGCMGELFFDQDDLNAFLVDCYKNRLQTALHTIGGRAIEMALNAHEHALNIVGEIGLRHRLEHVEMPTAEHISRSKKLGLIYSMQPTYEYLWGGPSKMYAERLGEHYKTTNPLREIVEGGITVCGGSESDVTQPDPLLGIHAAVNHPVKEHRMEVMDAIRMFTVNGAYAVFEDQKKGGLETGKLADIVILDHDILTTPKDRIKDIKVKTTIKSGCILFDSDKQ
ncbi:MAG TPA: amidohydrolase [Anaerovoracaceae bacterium]|nr:amidohydrolase [Anaerovoracaceae bacterium]